MSNGVDVLQDVFGLSQQDKKALDLASSLVGAISSAWGYVNTAKTVLTTLGVLSQADPVAEMRKEIDQLWKQFQGVVAALDADSTMRDVANQLSSARAELQNLTELAPDDPATVGLDSVWDGLRPLVLDGSARAVIALGSPAYWERVFIPELLYQKWPASSSHPNPQVESGLVFDYRLTLPAYLEAIAIRLTILVAVVKDHRRVAREELVSIATTLEAYFSKILDGIANVLWPPSPIADDQDPVYPGESPGVPLWIRAGALVGVVEIYSADDRVAAWPANEFPREGFSGTAIYQRWPEFLARYTVRNWVRWKALYNETGLNAVAATIVKLKKMADVFPASVVGPGGDYSMKQLAEALRQIGLYQNFVLPGTNNPFSLRELLKLLQTDHSAPYMSVRQTLTQ